MSDTFSKVEVITGVARRRRFSTELKLAVVAETMQPGMSVSYVARRHGLSPSLVFRWRQLMSKRCPDRTFWRAAPGAMISRFGEIDLCVVSNQHSNRTEVYHLAPNT